MEMRKSTELNDKDEIYQNLGGKYYSFVSGYEL